MRALERKDIFLISLAAVLALCLGVVCVALALFSGMAILRKPMGGLPFENRLTATLRPTGTASPVLAQPGSATSSPASSITAGATVSPSGWQPSPTIFLALPSATETAFQAIPGTSTAAATNPAPGAIARDGWCVPWNSEALQANVLEVVDGITIDVLVGGQKKTVRYIGLNLVEFEDDWLKWADSTEKNQSLVEGKTVILVKDTSDVDSEGLLPRYVLVDGIFVNQEMASSGYAVAQSTPPDTSCDDTLREAEAQAIVAGRGLWAPTLTPTRTFPPPTQTVSAFGSLVIVNVAYRGTVWEEPEEYVEVYNAGTEAVQLSGWTLRDIENHVFVFPTFVLGPDQYCRVYTNLYRPQNCGFSYFSPAPIWENNGDCAYIRDATGRPVSEFCYD
jgi:endonuclease YncB( thermonuclease family)